MYKSYLHRKISKIMNSSKLRSGKRTASVEKTGPQKKIRSKKTEANQPADEKSAEKNTHPAELEQGIPDSTPSTSSTSVSSKNAAKKPAAKGVKYPNRSVLQLKITLQGITPPIWRRIQVLNNDTFFDLRSNINEAMGWMSDRSHQFIVQNPKNNNNILIVNGALEGLIYDFRKERGRLVKEQNTKLSKYLTSPGDVILYEFDLADSWMHHIIVERILPPPSPRAEYPKIKAGKRACPPEDCGGVDGYMHLLEVYNNPKHAEYDELINEWLQSTYPGYDPEKFEKKNIFKKVWMWLPA